MTPFARNRQAPVLRPVLGPVLASVLAVGAICPPAAAQTAAPGAGASSAPAEARAHFERAVTFYGEGDFAAAVVEFKRAYEVSPAWQVLFNIGQSYFQMHDYADALVTLQRFLDQGGDRVPPDRRALVTDELSDLANRVGHAVVSSNLPGSTVTVDDAVAGVTPLRAPLLVSVGIRKITVSREGREPISQEISVAAGETADVHLDFAEAAPEPAVAPPPPIALAPAPALILAPASPPPPPAAPSRAPAFFAFGTAVAGVAVGSVFGVLALNDRAHLDRECQGMACDPGSDGDIHAISRDATVSTIGFGVAAAAVVTGIVLWVTEGGDAKTPREHGSGVSWRGGPGFVAGSF